MGTMYVPEKVYHPVGGINFDSNGIACRESECIDAVNLDILSDKVVQRRGTVTVEPWEYLYDVDGELILDSEGSPLIAEFPYPDESILQYHRYVSPNFVSTPFAFCSTKIYKFVAGSGWSEVSDGTLTGKLVDQWSICSFVDSEVGPTIVACGSLNVRSDDAMSGGSNRVLLYWDEGTDTFKQLVQRSRFPVVEEELFLGAGAGVSTATLQVVTPGTDNYDSSFIRIIPELTSFYTILIGQIGQIGSKVYSLAVGKVTLGDASDGALVDCYKIIPTDDTQIQYGDSSYVRLDGKEVSIEFLDSDFDGVQILTNYQYFRQVAHSPTQVVAFRNAIISANLFEVELAGVYHPYRVRWTKQGSIFETQESYYLDLVDFDITQIVALKTQEMSYYNEVATYVYAYKAGVIHRGSYNQAFNASSTEVPFLNFDIAMSDGVEAARTIVTLGKAQIFMGRGDIWIFDGVNRKSLTLDETTMNTRVRSMIFDTLDINNLNKTFAIWDESERKYMLFVKSTTDATWPTVCYVFSLQLNQWTRYIYPEVSAALPIAFSISLAINELTGAIEDLSGDIDSLGTRMQRTILLAMTSKSYVLGGRGTGDKVGAYADVAPDISYYFITRDFFGVTLQNQDRCQLVYLEAKSGTLSLSYNSDYSTEVSDFLEEQDVEFGSKIARNQYNLDVVGNNIRFLVQLDPTATFRWLQPFTIQQEESNV